MISTLINYHVMFSTQKRSPILWDGFSWIWSRCSADPCCPVVRLRAVRWNFGRPDCTFRACSRRCPILMGAACRTGGGMPCDRWISKPTPLSLSAGDIWVFTIISRRACIWNINWWPLRSFCRERSCCWTSKWGISAADPWGRTGCRSADCWSDIYLRPICYAARSKQYGTTPAAQSID